MTVTKYIVTTFIGRQKRYLFGTGKTTGNLLQVEYSTKQVDAELFDTEALAKEFIKNASNPYERVFTPEPIQVAEHSLETALTSMAKAMDDSRLTAKTLAKKLKKLR